MRIRTQQVANMPDTATRPGQHPYGGPFNWPIALVVVLVAAFETVAVYGLLAGLSLPLPAVAGLVAAAGVLIVGSALLVCYRWASVADAGGRPDDSSTVLRVAEVVVSITVVTVLGAAGAVLGLLLTASATLGGPDPGMADGDPLRVRLLEWLPRNRVFMRKNGRGTLPLSP